jgi:predicted NBD/HSP70 family sugar kinase
VDGLCGEAEAGKHPPPLHGGGVCKDGSEACLSLTSSKAFCAQNSSARETRLELTFSRYEAYEEKMREVHRPKGLLAYTTAAREYVELL